MEFIIAEQFKEQSEEVQKVFLDWWKSNLSEVDLIGYTGKSEAYKESFPSLVRNIAINCFEIGAEIIPLFTEGQLRKFIEDKTNMEIEILKSTSVRGCVGTRFYDMKQMDDEPKYKIDEVDLLQAYWKVACIIAKEEIA